MLFISIGLIFPYEKTVVTFLNQKKKKKERKRKIVVTKS